MTLKQARASADLPTPPGGGPLPVEWIRNVRIPMPDGVTLAADMFKPHAPGKYPAIIEYTPYHKNNNAVYGPRATRYHYFASHGYVFVNVDIRGPETPKVSASRSAAPKSSGTGRKSSAGAPGSRGATATSA